MRILYVDCDSLRPDHLGCYGYHRATSPTVDALAAEGVRFTNCFLSDAPCLPSRTALFSGRMGVRTGVVGHAGKTARMRYPGDGHDTDPTRMPLPMALSRLAGLHTTTFSTFAERHLAWHFYAGWDEVQKFSHDIGDEIATDVEAAVQRWLTLNADKDSWFLHLNFWDPHTQYRTPVEYGNPFAGVDPGWLPSDDALAAAQESYGPSGARDRVRFGKRTHWIPDGLRDRAELTQWMDGYDTGIRYFDDALGRVLDTLQRQGVLDETAVIVSSDHGENQGEMDLYGSHLTADAITCRVPMVVRWPGLDRGTVVDTPIHPLDLAPTLLELLGAEPPANWDGRSFAPALRGAALDVRPYLVFGQGAWFVQRGLLRDDHLYMRTYHAALNPMPDELLFDLAADPREEHDLAADRPDLVKELGGLMDDWVEANTAELGHDPLQTLVAEGGTLYPRLVAATYADHLRKTGRAWAADVIEARKLAPVTDRWDYSRKA